MRRWSCDPVPENLPVSERIILDLCGGTGSWSRPYKEAGYDVRVITFPDYDVERWREYPDLVAAIRSNRVYGILAAPPCTMFSLIRNDRTARKPRDLRAGMRTVNACLEIIHECLYSPYTVKENSLKFWALENPRGYLRRLLGAPALAFDPCDYGDPYTKRTHLWGMFAVPKKTPLPATATRELGNFVENVHRFRELKDRHIPPGYRERTGLPWHTVARSITPEGFARSFFVANN